MKSINNYKRHGEELYIFQIPPKYYDDPYKSDKSFYDKINKNVNKSKSSKGVTLFTFEYIPI